MVDEALAVGRRDPQWGGVARRNTRRYLIGLGASLIGNSAMPLVAGIWVKSLTASSSEAGLLSMCIYAPSLASPLAVVLADRVRRRRLLLGLNTFSAVVLLALLAVRGRAGLWIIFVVMTWYGMELTISGPAENGLFVEMLPARSVGASTAGTSGCKRPAGSSLLLSERGCSPSSEVAACRCSTPPRSPSRRS